MTISQPEKRCFLIHHNRLEVAKTVAENSDIGRVIKMF